MKEDKEHTLLHNLLYSCVDKVQRGNEQFVAEHSLGYIISGEAHFISNEGIKIFPAGTIGLVKRNQLVKSIKMPPPNGEFRAINIFFNQDILRSYSMEKEILPKSKYLRNSYYIFKPDPFIKGFFDSVMPYFNQPDQLNNALTELKTKEAIELVLRVAPELKDLLFDFNEPYKIDLEAFMNQHYKYNVPVDNFAKLTGRSLAGFKRDFEKVFHAPPGQWLQQKRLAEAYYLIKEKGIKPSAVYLEVGFENLSHFSFAFKKAFGIAPSYV